MKKYCKKTSRIYFAPYILEGNLKEIFIFYPERKIFRFLAFQSFQNFAHNAEKGFFINEDIKRLKGEKFHGRSRVRVGFWKTSRKSWVSNSG